MTGSRGPRTGARPERAGVGRAVVWLVALAAVAGIVWSVTSVAGEVRREVPDSEFEVTLDDEAGTLAVRHAGGDAIRDRGTEFLRVVVVDDRTDATATIEWAGGDPPLSKRGDGFPVDRGSSLLVDDPTADTDGDGSTLDGDASVGFEISPGDEVRVVWRGSRRTGDARTVPLANVTAG